MVSAVKGIQIVLPVPFPIADGNHKHHWIIETDTGQPYLLGYCRCGAVREFEGRVATLDRIYNINREKSKIGAERRNNGRKVAT